MLHKFLLRQAIHQYPCKTQYQNRCQGVSAETIISSLGAIMNRAVAFVVDSRVVVGAVIVAVLTWAW